MPSSGSPRRWRLAVWQARVGRRRRRVAGRSCRLRGGVPVALPFVQTERICRARIRPGGQGGCGPLRPIWRQLSPSAPQRAQQNPADTSLSCTSTAKWWEQHWSVIYEKWTDEIFQIRTNFGNSIVHNLTWKICSCMWLCNFLFSLFLSFPCSNCKLVKRSAHVEAKGFSVRLYNPFDT